MKVHVIHPGKQHVHRLCHALEKNNVGYTFYTNFWLKSKELFILKFSAGLRNFLFKRYSPLIQPTNIRNFYLPEAFSRILVFFGVKIERRNYINDRMFDKFVSLFFRPRENDIVVGYETATLCCFEKAKRARAKTVLDLAHIHYRTSFDIKKEHGLEFDVPLNVKKDAVKQKEYDLSDIILVISDFAKESLIVNGISERKIRLVNLGVDLQLFKAKNNYNNKGTFRLLYVGQISYFKGVDLLFQALADLNTKDISLTIVGNIVDEIQIPKCDYELVHFNFLPHEQLVNFYREADLFVMPSRLDSWGMVVLEAMACGTPVLVTKNVGAKDVVLNGGGIVSDVSAESIKENIAYFLNNRECLEEKGRQARKVVEQFSWDRYYSSVYEAVKN